MSRRVGLLGGTFDPVHKGHVGLGQVAEDVLGLSDILVVPTHVSPHRRQPATSVFHRFAMIALTVAPLPRWQASDMELRTEGPSYTTRTLQRLHAEGFHPSELFFLIGADAFADIRTWRDFPAILDRAHFAVISRPGLPASSLIARMPDLASRMTTQVARLDDPSSSTRLILIDRDTPDVSSTQIRQRCARGESLEGLVEPAVARYIERHGLYRQTSDGTSPEHEQAGRLHDIH